MNKQKQKEHKRQLQKAAFALFPIFPFDPADLPTLKSWLATQMDQGHGNLRSIDIDEILIGPDVMLELPAVLQRAGIVSGKTTLLVMDETPMKRGEENLKPFVQSLLHNAGYHVQPLWLKGDQYGLVHADFVQVEHVYKAITPGMALVALGSGTVTDIVKHAAYLYDQDHHQDKGGIVYICCPTANSVTAYAANMAVLLKDGVKRTIPSRFPTAIISDLHVLASAPKAMTLAGLGDCSARLVAYGDWYLASVLGMVDFYSEVPLAMLGKVSRILLHNAEEIAKRSDEGEGTIARGLLLCGMAQSIVNMSAPISGSEHVISHVLDMIAKHHHRSLALHGAQVGVATLRTSLVYRYFIDMFNPEQVNFDACYPDDASIQTHIQEAFAAIDPSGAMAQECWHDYSQKLALWRQNRPRFEQFCADWYNEHELKLIELVTYPRIIDTIFEQAGAPRTPNDLVPPISKEEYDFAAQNGHFIRSRFVLGDLLYFLGWKGF